MPPSPLAPTLDVGTLCFVLFLVFCALDTLERHGGDAKINYALRHSSQYHAIPITSVPWSIDLCVGSSFENNKIYRPLDWVFLYLFSIFVGR